MIYYIENLDNVLRGRKKSVYKWYLHPKYIESEEFNKIKYNLLKKLQSCKDTIYMIHKDGIEFKGNKLDFLMKYDVNIDYLDRVLRGVRKSTSGWKVF